AGEWVRIRSILDYFGDVQTIRYDGSPITLDMQAASHPVCKPLGWDSELIDNSFPMFGAFILEKINAPSFSGRAKSTPGLGLGLGV
ncbi:MAG: hypothetical protein LC130_25605, partial [Bryobacterales bacterium]|nr:hypothetical protein [Bryobacterales bacterium]